MLGALLLGGCTAAPPVRKEMGRNTTAVSHHVRPSPSAEEKVGSSSLKATVHEAMGVGSSLPPPLPEALGWIRSRTLLVLSAPSAIPTGLSATATASSDSYSVTLYHCPTVLALNDPDIGTGSCGALENYVGDFGSTRYATSSAAQAALLKTTSGAPDLYCPSRPISKERPLGEGIMASVLSPEPAASACMVEWREGEWKIEIVGDLTSGHWEGPAEQVVAYLHTHFLPPAPGIMTVDLAGDGEHTTLAWVKGDSLYYVGNYHEAIEAAAMAVTDRVITF